jgi:hypothetical protein
MMTGGNPILGNLHAYVRDFFAMFSLENNR